VDLGSPDLDGAKAFYGGLFGWEADVQTDPAAGGYTVFRLRGKSVAGLGPQQSPGPPYWTTYVSVADADTTVATAKGAGANVLAAPFDVLDAGRMAIFADPQGAVISVWQPKAHLGAELINEHGTLCWNELVTNDIEGAKSFYATVFGWGSETHGEGQGAYTEWKVAGQSVGGMLELGPQFPPGMPPCWTVYFAVDDCDAAVARVQELGGSVTMGPMDIESGRFAVVADPQGAVFSVITLARAM
jgi:hypothetical protein